MEEEWPVVGTPRPKQPGGDDAFVGMSYAARAGSPQRQQENKQGAADDSSATALSTSLVTVLSSAHGRQRRKERRIAKRDLQAAVKYGVREPSLNPRGEMMYKYTYADIVYITDITGRREVTSWVAPGVGMHIDKLEITEQMQAQHTASCHSIQTDLKGWTSHTVVVIDQSGSMRKDDVGDYGASRSDVVWAGVAIDFVKGRLESGEASSTDVMTVICMRKGSKVVIDRQPTDIILFNKLVDLLNTSEPHFDGNYIPALDAAEEKLHANTNGSCALMLLFLSDGRPSDNTGPVYDTCGDRVMSLTTQGRHLHHVQAKISKLASKFGRRLSVKTMGFGPQNEDFSVLKGMASTAEEYGSESEYVDASLDIQALTTGLIRFSSTLSTTKTECTDLGTGSARTVRNVERESKANRSRHEARAGEKWKVFATYGPQMVVSKARWNLARNEWEDVPRILPAGAAGVAMHKDVFGEGAERMVRRFQHVNVRNEFVGEALVAKEGRFEGDFGQGKDFHATFCKTQATAQEHAIAFNKKLEELSSDNNHLASLPRIQFLECSVFIVLSTNSIRPAGVLVEKMLDDTRYQKWNSNNGFVDGLKAAAQRQPKKISTSFTPTLDPVYEFEEAEEEAEEDVVDASARRGNPLYTVQHGSRTTAASDMPQVFSHFSYWNSQRKMLVCDLQGVLDDSTTPPVFELTDPVIHKYSESGRKNVYGRTDRGKKGIDDFWKTHVCTSLCHLLKAKYRVRSSARRRPIAHA